MSSFFEALMLVCFAAAWPAAIHKSWTSRTTRGKSLAFLLIVFTGYMAGIAHKIFGRTDAVVYMYAFNASLVAVDIALYARNARLDSMRDRESKGMG